VRALLVAAASLIAAGAALATPSGRAADECRGLMICIPVKGPWVAISAATRARPFPSARWQLKCPEGVVAGLDARLSDRAIDVDFSGLTGSPVNPGITTTNAAVFTGTYTGRERKATSFRPFIGCVPGGGGGRIPTSLKAFKPGRPTVIRARTLRVMPGTLLRATHACRRGEQLVRSSHAVGLYSGEEPPTPSQLAGVRVTLAVRDGQILVAASRQGLTRRIGVAVQVLATCTRGPG
jgi:hypothetical protein